METSKPYLAETSRPNFAFTDYLSFQQMKVQTELTAWFAAARSKKVVEAATYSLLSPSKRLRPLFCLETCRAFLGSEERAVPAAMALEMVHSYSLIHDDLPAMDNDDLRRGKPTNHKVYGVAMAILAGDGLLTSAFEVLATHGLVDASIRVQWVRELAEASGMDGMVLGQAIDIESDGKLQSLEALEMLHRKKTGALLAAAVCMGAISSKVGPEKISTLRTFALDMGLAFQIRDDILDVEGGVAIGKPVLSDERNDKTTYVSLLGLEKARQQGEYWYDRALRQLQSIEFPYENRLEELTRFVIERSV